MPSGFWENLNVTPRWVSSLEIHKTSPVIVRKQKPQADANQAEITETCEKPGHSCESPSFWDAYALPPSGCQATAVESLESKGQFLCFKQLLCIKEPIMDRISRCNFDFRASCFHMAWMQLARALNWGMWVVCISISDICVKDLWWGASWLTGSSYES